MAGNLFSLGALKRIRLQDVIFPKGMVKAHRGPLLGIEDARKILGVLGRLLVGTIVKPTAGFSVLEVLSKNINALVHVHRTMHEAITRDKAHLYNKHAGAVQTGPIGRRH